MSQGLTRQEVRRDEVREWMFESVGWLRRNARKLVYIAAALAVVLLVATFWLRSNTSQGEHAQDALSRAVIVSQGTIDPASPLPDDAASPVFSTEAERDAKAQTAFEQVAKRYSGSEAAGIAHLYLGEMAMRSGDSTAARAHWRNTMAANAGSAVAAAANLNLISLDRQEGRGAELVAELRVAIESGKGALPVDVLLHELAVTLEEAGNIREAKSTYQRLVDEFQSSPWSAVARIKVTELG